MDLFSDFSRVMLSILFEALPFVLLGSLLSGMMEVFLPADALARVLPRNRFLATLTGALAGLALPMCECGIVPVLRRLIRKGAPLHVAIAYMLAAPIVNPIVILSTLTAFSGMRATTMAGLRVALGIGIALIASGVVCALAGRTPHKIEGGAPVGPRPPWRQGIGDALCHAGRDFVEIGAFLAIGAAVAAALNVGVPRAALQQFAGHNLLSTLAMMAMAVALNLCSEADAFVAASFRDFSLSARLAFLVLGPMLDLKLMVMYTRVFHRRTIALLCASTILLVFAATFLVGRAWPSLRTPGPTPDVAPMVQGATP